MQQMGTTKAGSGAEIKGIETLAWKQTGMQRQCEGLAEVTHDARNMMAALGLYCDLLEEPGVLNERFAHYGRELRQVATASQRLVERLGTLDVPAAAIPAVVCQGDDLQAQRWIERMPNSRLNDVQNEGWDFLIPAAPVANLAAELLAMHNLLDALAGPGIAVTVRADGGARSTRITAEDLTRVLVNLVKNAAEAMPEGGRIHVSLRERTGQDGDWLLLAIEDNGPGIPVQALERVFESGFTGHSRESGTPATHRGLGLAITRAILEAAGGRIHAENRISGGARIVMELPAGR